MPATEGLLRSCANSKAIHFHFISPVCKCLITMWNYIYSVVLLVFSCIKDDSLTSAYLR